MTPTRWLPLLLAVLALALAWHPPILDEELWLQVAGAPWAAPYDWVRPMQPWGADLPENAYLFAHPPLWGWWLKLCGGSALAVLPFAALLGWAAARLIPGPALLVWMTCPILWLALQAGRMPDLAVTALGTAAVACWLDRRLWLAGLLLALAGLTKYPALVLVGVIAVHAAVERRPPWKTLLAFAAVWGGVQALLLLTYGEVHLIQVLAHAQEIGRGPLLSRCWGVLVRLGLLLGGVHPSALLALLPAALTPQDEGIAGILLLGLLGGTGGVLVGRAVLALRGPQRLFGLWALAVIAAVVVGHNYAGGRYLLPALVPLAVLLRRADPRFLLAAAAVQLLLAVGLVHGERAFARAGAEVAAALPEPTGRFTGEWAFRHGAAERGWTFWSSEEPLQQGVPLAIPAHHSPGPVPALPEVAWLQSAPHTGFVLTDLERGVGYHAETLGPLPFWFAVDRPLESVRVVEP